MISCIDRVLIETTRVYLSRMLVDWNAFVTNKGTTHWAGTTVLKTITLYIPYGIVADLSSKLDPHYNDTMY